jgi:hypothetical protein
MCQTSRPNQQQNGHHSDSDDVVTVNTVSNSRRTAGHGDRWAAIGTGTVNDIEHSVVFTGTVCGSTGTYYRYNLKVCIGNPPKNPEVGIAFS